ncbi:MAG: TonB-dependent receptor domain-containing protein [bacterium]
MHIRNRILFSSHLLCILLSTAFAGASENANTASVIGRILDEKEATPLAHVQVFIESLQRGDVSNSNGEFHLDGLPPGNYQITFQLQGYETFRATEVVLASNETVELTVSLMPVIIELDKLLVTATRNLDNTANVSQLVSVVSARKIQQRSNQQTPEFLREEVGVFVQKTNQGGGSPIIRGLKANKLLLLVDGIRLNNATYRGGNTQYLNSVDSGALARMEVVHGPISVLYGSDALGGVVNVITRTPKMNQGVGVRLAGSLSGSLSTAERTQTTHISLSGAGKRFGVVIDGSFKSFGDIDRGSNGGKTLMQRLRNDSRTNRDLHKKQAPNGYDAFDLTAKARLKVSDQQQITVAYQLNRQQEVPRYDVVEVRKDSIRLFDPQERDLVYLTYFNNATNRIFNSITATLSFHRQLERRIRQRFGSMKQTRDQFRTWTTGLQVQFNKVLEDSHHLVYGAEVYRDRVATKSFNLNTGSSELAHKSPLFPDGSSFLNFGVFVQDAFALSSRWRLTPGVRLNVARLRAPFKDDPHSDDLFGNVEQTATALTGSLGSQFHMSESVSLVANLAQGFRIANLDDVSKLGPGKGSSFFDIPNPEVEPEKSLSVDGGIKIHSRRLRADIIGFYNSITDLLVRVPAEFNGSGVVVEEGDSLQVFRKENAGKAFTAGFAIAGELAVNRHLVAFANLSCTYGQNTSDDQPLSGIPPVTGLVGLRWRSTRCWAEINARFAREQRRLSLQDKEDLRIPEGGTPGWLTLNFRVGIEVSTHLLVKFSAFNLLDRNYREHLSGFNAPGRNLVLGARVSF